MNNTNPTILELERNFSRLLLQEIQPRSFVAGHENPNDNITIAEPNAMHLKDYLERHEKFRTPVHPRMHKK